MDAAFARLRHHSRTTDQHLSEVARLVVERRLDTGSLTPDPAEPPAR